MSDMQCVWTRAECHHKGYKCSGCPLADLICDEMQDSLDISYFQGRADAIDEFVKAFVTHDEDYDFPCICPSEIEMFAKKIKEQKNESNKNN